MLSASDVTFTYGPTPVLRGVTMNVPDEGFVGILGPNGSGKTTMLKLLSGTRRPGSGTILLDGVDIARLPQGAIARRMAVVPQETQLAFDYSVLEVVMMGRYPHLGAFAVEGPHDHAVVLDALSSTGTAGFQDRPFSTLSGGEKQRVVIAGALAQIADAADSPSPLLLLDEPTAALDLSYQLEIGVLLQGLQQRRRLSIVVSTHDLNFAASLCTSLVLLKEGRVLAAGPTHAVLTPANIQDLYGVEADVHLHPETGHIVVIPIRRSHAGAR